MGARQIPFGKVAIVTGGVPVQLIAGGYPTGAGSADEGLICQSFQIQALPGNAGIVYIGVVGMVKATFVGVHALLPKPADPLTGPFASQSFSVPFGANALNLRDIYIDGTASDGVLITLIQC